MALAVLFHLVDGVVHRAYQAADVASVKRRDEGAADGQQHLTRDLVRLGFGFRDLSDVNGDVVPTLKQLLQRPRTGAERQAMSLEQIEEAFFLRQTTPETSSASDDGPQRPGQLRGIRGP